ncbi:helix-turn-helix domain-containing protein [Coprobacter sp.]
MAVTKKIVYSGDKFREYLTRHRITYQEASMQLGIDKNTIGKAVRGGNLNLNVLLTICNFYGLDISEFFKAEPSTDKNNGNYPDPSSLSNISKTLPFVAEEIAGYTLKNGISPEIEDLILSKDKEISLLKEMNTLYKERIDLLQDKLLSR